MLGIRCPHHGVPGLEVPEVIIVRQSRSMKKIVYILADNRSGSTLLDQLLGAHDQIVSLGEIHHLPAYALHDRSLYDPSHALACTCGVAVDQCQFWRKVEESLGRPLSSLALKLRFYRKATPPVSGVRSPLAHLARRTLKRNPQFIRSPLASAVFDKRRVAADSFALFDAIFDVTDAQYVVDSSKNGFRFRTLYDQEPKRVVGIRLTRDYRGTVRSKMNRGRELRASAAGWASTMREIQVLTRDITSDAFISVRYEDLCRDPRSELGRICDFLRVEFSEALLTRPIEDVHHLGGSPSKFDRSRREIRLDESYLETFSEQELAIMRETVGSIAGELGYD